MAVVVALVAALFGRHPGRVDAGTDEHAVHLLHRLLQQLRACWHDAAGGQRGVDELRLLRRVAVLDVVEARAGSVQTVDVALVQVTTDDVHLGSVAATVTTARLRNNARNARTMLRPESAPIWFSASEQGRH